MPANYPYVRLEITVDGVDYITVPWKEWRSCRGCFAVQNSRLCSAIVSRDCPPGVIWVSKEHLRRMQHEQNEFKEK